MTTINEALHSAAEHLSNTSDTARLDAEVLMAHALGVTRSELLLRRMRDECPTGFAELVERRLSHEPIAYITGEQEFYGRTFHVSPAVLIPRSDSEATVAAALDACPNPQRVLDCGVGSGALLLTILAERPSACGVGIDRSSDAVEIAGENAIALDLEADWTLSCKDWRQPDWTDNLGKFDLIVANPPYVEDTARLDPTVHDYEPHGAHYSGPEGLDDYRALIPQLPALLEPGGVAVLEIGCAQADAVSAIAAESGFSTKLRRDLAGRPRALILRRD
jgi:release factor glutamine methyltransferase